MSIRTHVVCDGCGVATGAETPEYGGYAKLPLDWVQASIGGAFPASLDLCHACYGRFSLTDVSRVFKEKRAARKLEGGK